MVTADILIFGSAEFGGGFGVIGMAFNTVSGDGGLVVESGDEGAEFM